MSPTAQLRQEGVLQNNKQRDHAAASRHDKEGMYRRAVAEMGSNDSGHHAGMNACGGHTVALWCQLQPPVWSDVEQQAAQSPMPPWTCAAAAMPPHALNGAEAGTTAEWGYIGPTAGTVWKALYGRDGGSAHHHVGMWTIIFITIVHDCNHYVANALCPSHERDTCYQRVTVLPRDAHFSHHKMPPKHQFRPRPAAPPLVACVRHSGDCRQS